MQQLLLRLTLRRRERVKEGTVCARGSSRGFDSFRLGGQRSACAKCYKNSLEERVTRLLREFFAVRAANSGVSTSAMSYAALRQRRVFWGFGSHELRVSVQASLRAHPPLLLLLMLPAHQRQQQQVERGPWPTDGSSLDAFVLLSRASHGCAIYITQPCILQHCELW